jgi:DNA-binding transcriptional LysR family regulator
MQTRALETLIRIDQVQSFSKAAQLQNMTLSALSMQVKALETELGAALFDRSFRPPKLTPLGKRIAAQARKVLGAQRALVELCGSTGALVGQFRLGFIQSASVRLLPDFLKTVRTSAPNASFELSSGLSEDLNEQVVLGLADAALVTRVPTRATGLHFEPVSTEEMAFAVPSAHALTPVNDLPLTLPFIHFRASSGIGNLIARSVQDQKNPPRTSIVLDSLEASVECVKAGLGYTLLPLPDILRCADDRVHVHSGASDALHRDIALVVRRENAGAPWVRIISDILIDIVARQAVRG